MGVHSNSIKETSTKEQMAIVHLTHTWGGGTQKYIDELCELFPNKKHIIVKQAPYNFDLKNTNVLHVHSTLVGENIGWDVLELVEIFKKNGKRVVLTIHDYQWLFPWCPNPTTEELDTFQNPEPHVINFKKLASMCDMVLMHNTNLLNRYEQFCGKLEGVTVTPPCDVPIHYERNYIPKNLDKIKIGFLGGDAPHKGFYHFADLARSHGELEFHVYGSNRIVTAGNIVSHGPYNDNTINDDFIKNDIHILLALSISEETYCYALTRMINSGLPIVYFNRGSFKNRLKDVERFFSVDSFSDLSKKLLEAVEYVKNTETLHVPPFKNESVQITDAYKNIYD